MATKVHWKESKLKLPVFRKSVRDVAEGWKKSETEPMRYSTYAFYLDRIGADLGSAEKWTTYCMRRGNANAILGVAPDAVVDQVMRHNPMTGCLANAYLNSRVGFNVQDAFLERDPSADGLTRAFTHMSIRCDPDVPRAIPRDELENLEPDPAITELSEKLLMKKKDIKQNFRKIKSAPAKDQIEYNRLRKDLKNAKKAFIVDMTKTYQNAVRERLHNEELEKQLSGDITERKAQPTIEHHLEERNQLQTILCDLTANLSPTAITDRKVKAIDMMVLLASRREIRLPQPSTPDKHNTRGIASHSEKLHPKEDEIPTVLNKAQCIYCIGNKQLSHEVRTRTFKRVSNMMNHVENVHLRFKSPTSRFACHHPQCKDEGVVLINLSHFKRHVLDVHKVKLRK